MRYSAIFERCAMSENQGNLGGLRDTQGGMRRCFFTTLPKKVAINILKITPPLKSFRGAFFLSTPLLNLLGDF